MRMVILLDLLSSLSAELLPVHVVVANALVARREKVLRLLIILVEQVLNWCQILIVESVRQFQTVSKRQAPFRICNTSPLSRRCDVLIIHIDFIVVCKVVVVDLWAEPVGLLGEASKLSR